MADDIRQRCESYYFSSLISDVCACMAKKKNSLKIIQ